MADALLNIDSEFTNHYKHLLDIQSRIKSKLNTYSFDLSKREITDAIIERMNAFWFFNVNNNKQLLDRHTNTTAADFFTETCLLFLKSYFEQKSDLKVCSEKSIVNRRKAIRPDVSIWQQNRLIAVIELKVSSGWKKDFIMQHLLERETQIKEQYPDTFFGVVAFWDFFPLGVDGWNTKYIAIKKWERNNVQSITGGSIENLIMEIENKYYKSCSYE